jgi:hypothetical protein
MGIYCRVKIRSLRFCFCSPVILINPRAQYSHVGSAQQGLCVHLLMLIPFGGSPEPVRVSITFAIAIAGRSSGTAGHQMRGIAEMRPMTSCTRKSGVFLGLLFYR